MAKRRTIGENPLDRIVPDLVARQRGEKAEGANARHQAPPAKASRVARPAPASVKPVKGAATPAQATRTESPTREELLSRIQSVEKQNELIKWLAYGAIALALLL